MLKSTVNNMCCPNCKSDLIWNIRLETKSRIINAEILCKKCNNTYKVVNTIGIFLLPDQKGYLEDDNFEFQKTFLSKIPQNTIERLISANPHKLNVSDLSFLSDVYMKQNKLASSLKVKLLARKKKYSSNYNNAIYNQLNNIKDIACKYDSILDIASGKGTLFKVLLQNSPKEIVGSDISFTALQNLKHELEQLNLYSNVSLIAMNAKMLPFRTEAFDIATTFHGINHIRDTSNLFQEILRVSSRFLAIEHLAISRDEKNYENGIKHTEVTLKDIAFRLNYDLDIKNKIKIAYEPTPIGDIIPMRINTYPKESIDVINCIIDIKREKPKLPKMLQWNYKDYVVFYYSQLDGDGTNQATSFVKYIKSKYPNKQFKRVFEWCAGPAFIGFALLFEGICEQLCVADINPLAIDCVKKTIEYNKLNENVVYYISDNLKQIPQHEKFDLVVSNPPNYFSLNTVHHDYEWLQNDLRPNDPQWSIHEDFYKNIHKHLNHDALLLIEEVEPFQSKVYIPITNVVPFDIRPNPPIEEFKKMIKEGNLEYINTEFFHIDTEEGIKMWLVISKNK